MTFYQCFQHSYSISQITPRQLPWHSPIKPIIIWLTKQIKIAKTVATFLGKLLWWSFAIINSRATFLEQVSSIDIFLKTYFFFKKSSLQSTRNCLLLVLRRFPSIWQKTFVVYSLSEPATDRNSEGSCLEIPPETNAEGKLRFS